MQYDLEDTLFAQLFWLLP